MAERTRQERRITMKPYTDIPQSKKLAEILPLESADMCYNDGELRIGFAALAIERDDYFPCWSLAALLDVLPEGTRILKTTNISAIDDTKYHCDCPKGNIDEWFDNPVDACYEIIIKLHEQNLL